MRFTSIVRATCVTAAAAFALVGICLQSSGPIDAAPMVNADLVIDQASTDDSQMAASSGVPTLTDWQNTRERPAKCRFVGG